MAIILGCLLVMFILVIFNVLLGGSYYSVQDNILVDTEALVDGGSSTFQVSGQTILFGIDSLEGMILILTAIIVIATVVGIQVLGSGLSDSSVRAITIVSTYSGLWIMLSILIDDLFWSIQTFGVLLYIILTIFYVIGVIQKLTG